MSASHDQTFYTPKNLKVVINSIKYRLMELGSIIFKNGIIDMSKEIEKERNEFFSLNRDLKKYQDILWGVKRQIKQDAKDPEKRREFFRRQNKEHEKKFYEQLQHNHEILLKKIDRFNREKRLK